MKKEEHFLFERYLLFAERGGAVVKGQVHHQPYQVADAEVLSLQQSLLSAGGLLVEAAPSLCHFSPGVDVEVFGPWKSDGDK